MNDTTVTTVQQYDVDLDEGTQRLAVLRQAGTVEPPKAPGASREELIKSLNTSIDEARTLAIFYSRMATAVQAMLDDVDRLT